MAARGMTAAALGAWVVFEDEAGFSMTPPSRATWARRARTPTVRMRGWTRCRVTLAGMCCYKPGERSRLIYKLHVHNRRPVKGQRRSYDSKDFRRMIVAAHGSLKAPIVLVWDNLNTHRTKDMRDFIAATEWLTVYHLPAYTPDLNPVEGIWSALRRTHHANHVFATPEDLVHALRTGLRRLQHHTAAINGCLTATGLT
ncbi:transposase [Streptomyces sp. NPDC059874]|uniref:transposase n=1 Tax=Streptomyces sp. NPDC059874 TaxID=3346983 RepID=UPI00364783FC